MLRNTAVAYVEQAGSRMAAALSYYSIFASGPVLLLTIVLGSVLFGEQATKEAVTQVVQRALPPGADAATRIAERMVQASTPTISLALLAGPVPERFVQKAVQPADALQRINAP